MAPHYVLLTHYQHLQLGLALLLEPRHVPVSLPLGVRSEDNRGLVFVKQGGEADPALLPATGANLILMEPAILNEDKVRHGGWQPPPEGLVSHAPCLLGYPSPELLTLLALHHHGLLPGPGVVLRVQLRTNKHELEVLEGGESVGQEFPFDDSDNLIDASTHYVNNQGGSFPETVNKPENEIISVIPFMQVKC